MDNGVAHDAKGVEKNDKACMTFTDRPEENDTRGNRHERTPSSTSSKESMNVICTDLADGRSSTDNTSSDSMKIDVDADADVDVDVDVDVDDNLRERQGEESAACEISPCSEQIVSTPPRHTISPITRPDSGTPESRAAPAYAESHIIESQAIESLIIPRQLRESPGSYVARMKRTLQRVHDSKASPASNTAAVVEEGKTEVTGEASVKTTEQLHAEMPPQERVGRPDEGRSEVDLVIAAVSAMMALSVPEGCRWMVWVVCCAITFSVPLRSWGVFEWLGCMWTAPASTADDQGHDHDHGNENNNGAGVDQRLEAHSHRSSSIRRGNGIGSGERDAAQDGAEAESVERSCQYTEGAFDNENLNDEVRSGLSEAHMRFITSAGKEEEKRLLHQCLEYANGDIPQAVKVCRAFCNFRLGEGWDLVLSAAELEGPLRSRVHTVTEGRDRVGRGIVTFSPGKLDMSEAPAAAYHKMLCYVLQEVIKERELQTKGLVLLVDSRGVGVNLLRHFHVADYRRGMRMLSGAFPMKLKAIRILHVNRALSSALSVATPLLSAKMRDRLEIVSSESAKDGSFVDGLADPSAVPVELGVGGTWTGSHSCWESWIRKRVS